MDKEKLLLEIEKNIKDLNKIQAEKENLMLALYEKTIDEIKEKKLKEVKEYFKGQIEFFGQDIELYQSNIDKNLQEYEKQIEQLINAYNYLYIESFNYMKKASNDQIIAIGNIIKLWDKNDVNLKNKIIAVVQKKVNYSVIVEECKARLNWCIENVEKDLNTIFVNNFYQMQIYKSGFFENLKRKIINFINGKNKLNEVIKNYENKNLSKISKDNNTKVIEICAITSSFIKQIKNVEKQIEYQYNQSIQNA